MFSSPSSICLVARSNTHLHQHLVQIGLGIHPGGDRIAEEDKVGHDSHRIHGDHLTHAAERRVLLLVVPYVAQRRTPGQQ